MEETQPCHRDLNRLKTYDTARLKRQTKLLAMAAVGKFGTCSLGLNKTTKFSKN